MDSLGKRILVAAVLAACSQSGMAQTPGILIEACNSIADADKRLECLKAAMGKGVESAGSEAVARAFTVMESNLSVGISLNNYQAAMLELGREVALFARSAAPAQKQAVEAFDKSLDTYKDAGTFWATAIQFYSRRDNSIAYFGGLPMRMVGLEWMITKHGLPTAKSDIWGINVGVPTELGRSVLWSKAKDEATLGLELLKGDPSVAPGKSEPAAAVITQ